MRVYVCMRDFIYLVIDLFI